MKCEICGKDILENSQCIDYKYYHNDCIKNLTKENKKHKEIIDKVKIEISSLMSRYFYDKEFCIEDTHLDKLLQILDGGEEIE